MSTQLRDIYWLAGLIEGEGCFRFYKRPDPRYASYARIDLKMTDRDVVDRARSMLAPYKPGGISNRPNRKTIYSAAVAGARAVGWMMTLYPLMGARRKRKIREVLSLWMAEKPSKFTQRHDGLCRTCGKEPSLVKVNGKDGRTCRHGKCRQCYNAVERDRKRDRSSRNRNPEQAAIGRERSRQKTIARNIANTGVKWGPRRKKDEVHVHGAQTAGRAK